MELKKSLYQKYTDDMISHINVGVNEDIKIRDFAKKISKIINYKGKIVFDTTRPDGVKRKLMDSKLAKKMGWKAKSNLENNLKKTLSYYIKNIQKK